MPSKSTFSLQPTTFDTPQSILQKTAMFELSHQVATGNTQAKKLSINLKTLQQRIEDTDIDATILQDLNTCVAKSQELSTVSFLFIEKEAENYVYPISFPLTTSS
jgi:uncharacterized coiled-coil protein SlyX